MLGDIRQAKNVYIVTGYTDMQKRNPQSGSVCHAKFQNGSI